MKWQRHIAVAHVEDLRRYVFTGFQLEVAGSVRRECEEVHDIDLVIMANSRDILARLKTGTCDDVRKNIRIKSSGDRRVRFVFRGIPVDVCCVSFEWEWEAMLLHHTGSMEFNIWMRSIAKSLGWKLNEYGLQTSGGHMLCSEAQIMLALRIAYIDPTMRTDNNNHWRRL